MTLLRVAVTSKGLCHKERGSNSLLFVLVGEHGIKNPLYTVSVCKDPHWSCSPAYFSKPPFYGICSSDFLPPGSVLERKVSVPAEFIDQLPTIEQVFPDFGEVDHTR